MAQLEQPISRERFRKLARPILGLKVSRPWLGYGNVLFLELGRLHTETVVRPPRKTFRFRKGQVTLLLHSSWRAERAADVAFGIDSPTKALERGVKGLRGCSVTGLRVAARVPELEVELDGELLLRSFRSDGPPDWDLFLHDARLFPRERRWEGIDHSLGAGISDAGRLVRWVCYDHDAIGIRE